MSTHDQIEQTHTYARAVAKALGDGWLYTERRDEGQLQRWAVISRDDDGAEIHVSHSWRGNRYHWTGAYPRDASGRVQIPYGQKYPEIYTALDKSPERAIGDITRRLLPDYLKLLSQSRERIAQANAYDDTTARNATKLAAILGRKPDKHPRNGDTAISFHMGEFYGDVAVNGDSIRIDLRSLTVEQAERVLRMLVPKPPPTREDLAEGKQ